MLACMRSQPLVNSLSPNGAPSNIDHSYGQVQVCLMRHK